MYKNVYIYTFMYYIHLLHTHYDVYPRVPSTSYTQEFSLTFSFSFYIFFLPSRYFIRDTCFFFLPTYVWHYVIFPEHNSTWTLVRAARWYNIYDRLICWRRNRWHRARSSKVKISLTLRLPLAARRRRRRGENNDCRRCGWRSFNSVNFSVWRVANVNKRTASET